MSIRGRVFQAEGTANANFSRKQQYSDQGLVIVHCDCKRTRRRVVRGEALELGRWRREHGALLVMRNT